MEETEETVATIVNYHLRCENDADAQRTYSALPPSIKQVACVCMTFHPSIPAIIVVTLEGPHDQQALLDLGFEEFVESE